VTTGSNKTNSQIRRNNSQTQQNQNPKSGKEVSSQIKWKKGGMPAKCRLVSNDEGQQPKENNNSKTQTQQVR